MTKRHKRKVSELQKEQVRAFTVAGMLAKHIATEMGLSRATVSKIQKSFGLSPHSTEPLSPEMVQRILRLFGRGQGVPYISRTLSVPAHRVEQIKRERGFRHPKGTIGCRYSISREMKRAIRRRFRTFEKRIADEYGVTEGWVQKLWRRRN
jgi:transposase